LCRAGLPAVWGVIRSPSGSRPPTSLGDGACGPSCRYFAATFVRKRHFRAELAAFCCYLHTKTALSVRVARLSRVTLRENGLSGRNCSTFSSNSPRKWPPRTELLDFLEHSPRKRPPRTELLDFLEQFSRKRSPLTELLDFLEQLSAKMASTDRVARLSRAIPRENGLHGPNYSTFSSNYPRKRPSRTEMLDFLEQFSRKRSPLTELLDFLEQLPAKTAFTDRDARLSRAILTKTISTDRITRLSRATTRENGLSGRNCSTFSSNSPRKWPSRAKLLDFLEQLPAIFSTDAGRKRPNEISTRCMNNLRTCHQSPHPPPHEKIAGPANRGSGDGFDGRQFRPSVSALPIIT
jgi:hypothetical protein